MKQVSELIVAGKVEVRTSTDEEAARTENIRAVCCQNFCGKVSWQQVGGKRAHSSADSLQKPHFCNGSRLGYETHPRRALWKGTFACL